MPSLLWDASALAKRYIKETGTSTVGALFAMVSAVQMLSTFTVYVETRGDDTVASSQRQRSSRALSLVSSKQPLTSCVMRKYCLMLQTLPY